MNRTGLFIALGLALAVGLLFGIFPELDLKLAGAVLRPDDANRFRLKVNALAAIARDGAMWIAWGLALPAIVALVVKLVLAGPAAADLGPRDRIPAGHADAVRRRAHQSHLQELLGPAAPGGGDASSTGRINSWRGGIRAARCAKNCSFFSGEGATAFWTYRAGGADAAGMAAAGLCRGDPVRRDAPACCGWRSAGISSPMSRPPGW